MSHTDFFYEAQGPRVVGSSSVCMCIFSFLLLLYVYFYPSKKKKKLISLIFSALQRISFFFFGYFSIFYASNTDFSWLGYMENYYTFVRVS